MQKILIPRKVGDYFVFYLRVKRASENELVKKISFIFWLVALAAASAFAQAHPAKEVGCGCMTMKVKGFYGVYVHPHYSYNRLQYRETLVYEGAPVPQKLSFGFGTFAGMAGKRFSIQAGLGYWRAYSHEYFWKDEIITETIAALLINSGHSMFHFAEAPIEIKYHFFKNKNFSLFVSTGAAPLYSFAVSRHFEYPEAVLAQYGFAVLHNEQKFFFTFQSGIGVAVNLDYNSSLFVEPVWKYFSPSVSDIINDQPHSIGLKIVLQGLF
jgi:hypothetical protein